MYIKFFENQWYFWYSHSFLYYDLDLLSYATFMENIRPKIWVGVIVCRDSKILLGKRKNSHGDGTWSFPGGHLEWGESWEECARRETLEEVGIELGELSFETATNDVFDPAKHYVTIFMKWDYKDGEVTNLEPEKCERWEWFSWENLPAPLFLPIQHLLEQKYNPFQ